MSMGAGMKLISKKEWGMNPAGSFSSIMIWTEPGKISGLKPDVEKHIGL